MQSDSPRPDVAATDQGALILIVRAIWHGRYWVVAAALVGAGAAVLISARQPQMYRAGVTFLVRSPTDAPVNLTPFRVLLQSPHLVGAVSREFGQVPFSLDVVQNADANLLSVFVTLSDQGLAPQVANRFAEAAVAYERRVTQQQASYAVDVVKAQMDEVVERLRTAETKQLQFRRTAQIDVLKKDAEQVLESRTGLDVVEQDLAAATARLQAFEAALAEQAKVVVLTRTIDREPALLEAAREAGAKGLVGLGMKDEELNDVHQMIATEVAKARAEVAGLTHKRRALIGSGVRRSKLPQFSSLYEAMARDVQLEADVELARKVYGEVATNFEQARINLSSKLGQLSILDPADSAVPVSSGVVRDALLGAMVGIGLSLFVLLAMAGARAMRPLLGV